jgi:hypothetical protein
VHVSEPTLLPGFVNSCEIKESATGRKQKYITAIWCYGNGDFKTKQLLLSATRIRAPDGTRIPKDEESVLFRPPPKKKKRKTGEEEDEVVPMSQLVDLATDKAFASLPSPSQADQADQADQAVESLNCVELEIDWKEDDGATEVPINGSYNTRNWSMKDRLGNVYSNSLDRVCSESRIDYFFRNGP